MAAGIIVLLVIATLIGANNSDLVSINYLLAKAHLPLSSLLAIAFLLGVAFASLIWLLFAIKMQWSLSRLQSRNKKLIQSQS